MKEMTYSIHGLEDSAEYIFTQSKIFKVHLCCSMYQNFIPLKDWIIMIVYHILFIHLFVDGHLGCFYSLAIMKNAAEHLCTCFCVECAFVSLGYVARSEIAGVYGNSMFNYLRNCHMVFQSSCTISRCHQQCVRGANSPDSNLH